MPDRPPESPTEALLAQAGWVRGLALSLVGRAADADDAAQATWLAALEKPPALRSSPRAWLRSVLRNVVARSARRSDLRSQAETRHDPRPDPQGAGDVVQRAETHRKLVDHVMALPEPGRSTILMHYFDGLSLADIARKLGVPTGTVRSRHHRAVEDLRARLGAERSDWRALLLPIAAGPAALPAAAAAAKTAAEIIAMTLKAKVGIAAAALIVLAVGTFMVTSRDLFGPDASRIDSPAGAVPPGEGRPEEAATSAVAGARKLVPSALQEAGKVVIRGRVRAADATPLDGARVLVARYDVPEPVDLDAADAPAGFPRVVAPNAGGEFAVEVPLAAPAFTLVASAKGCAPQDVTVRVDRLTGPVEILLQKSAVVTGTVQTLDRVAIPGAKVALRLHVGGVSLRREARSDAEGAYRIEGLPRAFRENSYLFEASAEGFAPQKLTQLGSDARGAIRQDVFMTRGATVRGVVVDSETGAPLKDARVVLWNMNPVWRLRKPDGSSIPNPDEVHALGDTPVGADGTFAFERVPSWGVHVIGSRARGADNRPLGGVAAIAPGHAPRVVGVDVPPEGSITDLVIRCKPSAQVRGRVVDPEGRPVPGARVSRSPDEDENEEGWLPRGVSASAPSQDTKSDDAGGWVLAGIPCSNRAETVVEISAQGTSWPVTNTATIKIPVAAGADDKAPDLVLAPDWEKSAIVHVRTEDGQPVWGAAILYEPHTDYPVAFTDRAGKALVKCEEGLNDQTRFSVMAAGFGLQDFTMTPGTRQAAETTVTLHPGRVLSGTVIHPDGSPAVGTQVLITNMRLGAAFPATSASTTGAFGFSDLPPGPYELSASLSAGPDRGEWTNATLSAVPEGPGVQIVITRPTAIARAGLVVVCTEKMSGSPMLKGVLELLKDEVEVWGRPTAPGEFTFPEVEPGEWLLRVHPFTLASHERKVVLEAGKQVRVSVVLEKGVTLRGRLLHPGGKPFTHATFDLIGSRQYPVVAPDGTFEISGLVAGSRIGFHVEQGSTEATHEVFATRPADFVSIPTDRSELTAEVPLVAGGILLISIDAPRLFHAGHTSTEAMRDLARRSRLEIKDSEGKVVLELTGLERYMGSVHPVGRYTVRLEVPGVPAQQSVVELSKRRFDLEFKVE